MLAHTCHLQGNGSTYTICKIVHTHTPCSPVRIKCQKLWKKRRDSYSFHKEPIGCVNSPAPPPSQIQFLAQCWTESRAVIKNLILVGWLSLILQDVYDSTLTLNQLFLMIIFFSCCRKKRFLKYPIEFGPTAPGSFADTMVFRAPALGKTFTVHLKGTGLWSVISSQCDRLVISHLISVWQACDQSSHLSVTGLWSVNIISVRQACDLSSHLSGTGLWSVISVWQACDQSSHLSVTGLWSVISVVQACDQSSQCDRLVISHLISQWEACDQSTSSQCDGLVISHLSATGLWSVISSQCYRLVISKHHLNETGLWSVISVWQACDQSSHLSVTGLWSVISSPCDRLVISQHHLSDTGLWSVIIISVLQACDLSAFQWCKFVVCWRNLGSRGLWSVKIISVVQAYGLLTELW